MTRRRAVLGILISAAILTVAFWLIGKWRAADREVDVAVPGPEAELPVEVPPPLPYEFETLPGLRRGDPDREFVVIRSRNLRLPFTRLHTMVSEPGEDKIAFLHRVRADLVTYSDKQVFEACGEICTDGENHAVIVSTTSASMYCLIKEICPKGFVSTGQGIHSHCPYYGNVRATEADERISDGKLRKGKAYSRCDTERFSSVDFSGRRPGWLAGRKALYRHDGPTRIETFHPDDQNGSVPAAAP